MENLNNELEKEHLKNEGKNLPIVFLKFMKSRDLKVSLYKMNASANNWDKIEIDKNNPRTTILTNCN